MTLTEQCREAGDLHRFGYTQCAYCYAVVTKTEAVMKTVHVGRMTQTEHWCSEDCYHTWYIRHLNEAGL